MPNNRTLPGMISLTQIKAARALLNWTQETLAKASGLSLPGINNLERGLTSPRKDTLAAIENALQAAGIEFIETSGVKLKTPDVATQIIEGPDWLKIYDQDIFSVIREPSDEVVCFSSDERPWMVYGGITNHLYLEHKKKIGFSDRILVPETVDFITLPPETYRTLNPAFFSECNYQVYADRLALILWPARKVIINRSQALADSYRAQFDALWAQAKPLSVAKLKTIERWKAKT